MGTATSNLGHQVAGISGQLNSLIGILQQCSNANRNTAGTFGAFTAAGLAEDAIRSFLGALKELTVESTLYAARTQELGVALDAVAKASGSNISVIKQQEFAMKQLNITTQDARETLARFIQADLDIGKSGALARTAQDLAVIAGFSTSEEINKLVIAIQTLQSRNLRTAGVFFTVDEVLDRLAKTTHRARDSFSTFEKQQAVLNAVLEFGTRVTGTYEAAMETASKQIRSMERLVREAQNAFGSLFIPTLEVGVRVISEMFIWLEKHPKLFGLMMVALASLSAAFIFLNTNLLASIKNHAALAIVGIGKLIPAMTGLHVNLRRTALALGIVDRAAIRAATSMTALQLAAGGVTAIIGVVALVVGLGGALLATAEKQDKLVKVTDTSITQGTAAVKSLKERRDAVLAYQKSLESVSKAGILPDLITYRKLTSQVDTTKEFRLPVQEAEKNVRSLETSIARLSEQMKQIPQDSLENLAARSKISAQLDQESQALEHQKSVRDRANESLQKNRQLEEQLRQSFGLSKASREGLVNTVFTHIEAEKAYSKIQEGYTAQEKAVLRAHRTEIEGLNELERRQNEAAASRVRALAANLSILSLQEKAQKDAIDRTENELGRLEKSGQGFIDRYGASLEKLQYVLALVPKLIVDNSKDITDPFKDAFKGSKTPFIDLGSQTAGLGIGLAIEEAVATSYTDQIVQANKLLAEQASQLVETQSQMNEFNRQLELLREGYKLSSEELVTLLFQIDQSDPRFRNLVGVVDNATASMLRFKEATAKAAAQPLSFDEIVNQLKIPSIQRYSEETDIAAHYEKLGREFQVFVNDVVAEKERIGVAIRPEEVIRDPKMIEEFVKRGFRTVKEVQELLEKSYAGNVQTGLTDVLNKFALDSETYFANFGGDFAAVLRDIVTNWKEADEAAKKAARAQNTELSKMQESLKRTKEQINSFLNVGSPEFKIRMELEKAERTKKDLETLLTLRHKLGIPLTLPIELGKVQKSRQELEVLAKVFDEIREANNEIYTARLGAGAPLVTAEVRAQTTLLKLIRERREEENQLQADIATAILRRTQLERDARERTKGSTGRRCRRSKTERNARRLLLC
jgi:hypothetical protein